MSSALIKAKQIRLLVLDVDGVLTSGLVTYTEDGMIKKSFNLHDGLGIKLMQNAGIPIAIISGKESNAVKLRAAELGIQHVYLGQNDKLPAYEELKKKLNMEDAHIAYMGDDLPDFPLLRRAGLAITVPDAPEMLKQQADVVSARKGGDGAVREVCEYILKAQNKFDTAIQPYTTR